jgi:glucans biosynthesis protein
MLFSKYATLIAVAVPLLLSAQQSRVAVNFDYVAAEAARIIESPTPEPAAQLSDELANLDYDDYRNIRFRPSEALWWNDSLPYRVEFFHLGHIFKDPVQIFEISDTHAQEIPFLEDAFIYEKSAYKPGLFKKPPGYAGIRIKSPLNREDVFDDLIVFQGASYFRALGQGQTYGLSLRGLSMNMLGDREGFPRFTRLWLKKPSAEASALTVFALLEGREVAGAYQFEIRPGGPTEIDVRARLFFRDGAAGQAGFAPLTSMFYFGENSNFNSPDWRPEVHDSDGLLIHADNMWTWHALENIPGRYSRQFRMARLNGFGLMQRDRDFGNYKDLEARYEKRPSAWIEPTGNWPRGGAVVLYTFGTRTETSDNVNAFWKPTLSAETQGDPIDLSYRISLRLSDPPTNVARVLETRVGQRTLDESATTILIEFERPESLPVDQIGQLSAGFETGAAEMIGQPVISHNEAEDRIRLFAHFRNPPETPDAPFEMSAQLLQDGHQMTERWSYSWMP